MKVILRENIKGVGNIGDLVTVADGYAVNYLLPRNIAIKASPSELNKIQKQKEERLLEGEHIHQLLFDAIEKINRELVFEEAVNEKGALFNSVDAKRIGKRIADIAGIQSMPKIELDEAIRQVGDFYAIIVIGNKKIKINIRVKPTTKTQEEKGKKIQKEAAV